MAPIRVIPIDNNAFETSKMNLPRSVRGCEFVLDFYDWIQSEGQFRKVIQVLDDLNEDTIVILDLGLDDVAELHLHGLKVEYDEFLRAYPGIVSQSGYNSGQWPGLYLAQRVLQNPNWRGVLMIASNYLSPPYKRVLQTELSALLEQASSRVAFGFGEGDLFNHAEVDTSRAIELFLAKFGDEVAWFLHPPGESDDYMRIQWFDGNPAHPGHRPGQAFYASHLAAVTQRFRKWDSERFAKALVHTTTFTPRPTHGEDYFVAASCLSDFFPGMKLTDLAEQDQFLLPIQPAFPFLVAVRTFFQELCVDRGIHKWGELVQLKFLDSAGSHGPHHLALVIDLEGPWHIHSKRAWLGRSRGESSFFGFQRALRAHVDHSVSPETAPLTPALGGLDGVTFPWLDSTHIGVAWETKVVRQPTK